ncbi:MAG: hypothetical protein U0169_25710 [Polyangiaceae bacterium]
MASLPRSSRRFRFVAVLGLAGLCACSSAVPGGTGDSGTSQDSDAGTPATADGGGTPGDAGSGTDAATSTDGATTDGGTSSDADTTDDASDDAGPTTYRVGGTVRGLAGTGLVLENRGGDPVTITASGAFTFPTALPRGGTYAATVRSQPTSPNQTCTATNGTGTILAGDVGTILVDCTTTKYALGGRVSGLVGTGLVLGVGGANLNVTANGTFTVPGGVADGTSWSVTVVSEPSVPSQACTVTNGTGSIQGADVTNVSVACVTRRYTLGGTVTGLLGTGLVLRVNGGDDVGVAVDGTFTFPTPLDDSAAFVVTVGTQPDNPRQTCFVSGGNGHVVGGNVSTVLVNCAADKFAVGGTISGLEGSGLVLRNSGEDDLTVAANGEFSFRTTIDDHAPYLVTVETQPTAPWQTCTVTRGAGNVSGGPVTDVAVACSRNRHVVRGTLENLVAGTQVVLANGGADPLTLSANGAFAFATSVESGRAYSVAVRTQPTGPSQTCTVTGATGTIVDEDADTTLVSCETNVYAVGGTVTGLPVGANVSLQLNEGEELNLDGNRSFVFPQTLASGTAYDVTISQNSVGVTCLVTHASGTVTTAAIGDVTVTCSAD